MTAKNRATQIGKLHTALKKHFKPAPPSPGRPLMEHVLYACLLEDTPADLADEGFAKCEQEFFDWNEVRVTTVTELAEVLSRLPSANAAAVRLKKNLQSMFETFYNFDIDYLKKENLGKAVAKFEAMPGMTPFVLSYFVQHGLGGHAIPIDKSAMKIMWLAGIVSDAEAESGKVPGLERTIPKNRSIEFSSLLHQAGIAFQANPKDKAVWDVLLAVNKEAKTLFDRPPAPVAKPTKKSAKAAAAPPSAGKIAATPAGKASSSAAAKSADDKKSAKAASAVSKPTDTAKTDGKSKPQSKAKSAASKPASVNSASAKSPAAKPSAAKAITAPRGAASKPVSEKKSPADKPTPSSKKPAAKSTTPPAAKPSAKKAPPKKPLSAKSTAAKPLSKKTESKPAAKKPLTEKLVPAKKVAASTNKKLTKQKPR